MKKIIQFGYNVKVPEGVMDHTIPVVDCRVIPNPYPKHAKDPVAARHAVRSSEHFAPLVEKVHRLLRFNGVVAVGCGYGVHRSGAVVEEAVLTNEWDIEVVKMGKA